MHSLFFLTMEFVRAPNWVVDTVHILWKVCGCIELGINFGVRWEVGGGAVIDVSKDAHGAWKAARTNVVQKAV